MKQFSPILIPFIVIWLLSFIYHKLNLAFLNVWYGFPLYLTFISIFILSCIFAIYKIMTFKN